MNSDSMEWRRLDDRALAYARGELDHGKSIARQCLPRLEEFEPWARVPAPWPSERVHDFRLGRVNPTLHREQLLPVEPLLRHVEAAPERGSNLLLFEDPYAEATDPSIVAGATFTPIVTMGNEVYQLIGPDEVGEPLHFPVAEYPIIGIATSLPSDARPLEAGATITPELLVALADNAVALLVAAWDAESYVFLDRGLLSASQL